MAEPAVEKHGSGTQHVHHEIVHHYSPAPIIVGLGFLVLYLGLSYFGGPPWSAVDAVLPIGVLIVLAGALVWVKEDMQFWTERRTDPGVSPGADVDLWGMWFFLGTEVMLFGGLFATFFTLRAEHPADFAARVDELPILTTGINTLILLTSGLTCHYSLHALKENNRRNFLGLLVATIVLGAIFLGVQVYEYMHLIGEGMTIGSGHFGSAFYLLTGTHGFHVFLGLTFLLVVLFRGLKGQFDATRHVAFDSFAIYWHFVDIVWILLFFVVYVGVI